MRFFLADHIPATTLPMRDKGKKIAAGMLLSVLALSCGSAYAGTYDAFCSGARCTVLVTPDSIRSPYGEIPTSRVTYWGSSGDSKTSIGTGVATTILFGGIGLLGFLAKNHDYQFTIGGYDAAGKKVSMLVQFKNDKPAKRMAQELFSVTGLGMNQTRTIEDIKAAEANVIALPKEALGPMPGRVSEPKLGPLASNTQKAASRNCWSIYLRNNPAMKKWAEVNQPMAEQNKKRFDDC